MFPASLVRMGLVKVTHQRQRAWSSRRVLGKTEIYDVSLNVRFTAGEFKKENESLYLYEYVTHYGTTSTKRSGLWVETRRALIRDAEVRVREVVDR